MEEIINSTIKDKETLNRDSSPQDNVVTPENNDRALCISFQED